MRQNKTFQLRPKAVQDLENIYNYSVQEFSFERAEKYIIDLDSSFYKLAGDPSLGRNYNHIRSGVLAFNVVSHIVFFRLSKSGIIILRVLHNSMDFGRHLT